MKTRQLPWKTWGDRLKAVADEFRALPGTTEDQHGIRIDWDDEKVREIYTRAFPAKSPSPKRTTPAPTTGPGTELAAIFSAIGAKATACAGKCAARRRQMDRWGVAGCRENRDTIIKWMREAYSELSIKQKLAAATNAVTSGIAFKLNPLDPIPSIVDEAIRRAEAAAIT